MQLIQYQFDKTLDIGCMPSRGLGLGVKLVL